MASKKTDAELKEFWEKLEEENKEEEEQTAWLMNNSETLKNVEGFVLEAESKKILTANGFAEGDYDFFIASFPDDRLREDIKDGRKLRELRAIAAVLDARSNDNVPLLKQIIERLG